MASNVLILTLLGAGCVCSMCCTSSVVFIKHQRDLAKDAQDATALIQATNAQIAIINGDKPSVVALDKPAVVLSKPQDMTPRAGAFRVPWWDGCLVAEKDRVTYTERNPTKCATGLVRVPLSPFQVTSPANAVVNDAFVIKSGEMYVARDWRLTSDSSKAVRLRRDAASGTIEIVGLTDQRPSRPCWNIRSKKIVEESDRVKYKECARWEIP